MTLKQKNNLYYKLDQFKTILNDAKNEYDPYEACMKLRKAFGETFPADKNSTAKKSESIHKWGSTNNA